MSSEIVTSKQSYIWQYLAIPGTCVQVDILFLQWDWSLIVLTLASHMNMWTCLCSGVPSRVNSLTLHPVLFKLQIHHNHDQNKELTEDGKYYTVYYQPYIIILTNHILEFELRKIVKKRWGYSFVSPFSLDVFFDVYFGCSKYCIRHFVFWIFAIYMGYSHLCWTFSFQCFREKLLQV